MTILAFAPRADSAKEPRSTAMRRILSPLGPGRPLQIVAVVLLVAALGAGVVQLVQAHRDALPADAAFRFDGRVTTVTELNQQIKVMKEVYGVTEPSGTARAAFDRDAAKSVAVAQILDRAAQAAGIVISDKTAEDRLDQVIGESAGGEDAFAKQLSSAGLGESDIVTQIKRMIAGTQLFDKVTAGIVKPTTAQMKAYYVAHRADMAKPAERKLENIVVASRSTARAVAAKLRAGASFADVARSTSLDQSTKDKGGQLGWVSQKQLAGGYGKAAFAAVPGAVFGPVKTQYGWNVGVAEATRAAVPQTFAQVRKELSSEMLLDSQLKAWRTWLAGKIAEAHVQYAAAYKPANPDAAPADLGLS